MQQDKHKNKQTKSDECDMEIIIIYKERETQQHMQATQTMQYDY